MATTRLSYNWIWLKQDEVPEAAPSTHERDHRFVEEFTRLGVSSELGFRMLVENTRHWQRRLRR